MVDKDLLLQELAAAPEAVAEALRRLEGGDLRRRGASGSWSAMEVLSHLLDVERRFLVRIRRVLTEDRPHLAPIHPADYFREMSKDAGETLRLFREARGEMLEILTDLASEQWEKGAYHDSFGETDVAFLIDHLREHDGDHLEQLIATGRERP
jgi:uncharacterized damage-inducible protein DinB